LCTLHGLNESIEVDFSALSRLRFGGKMTGLDGEAI
jgi:hypothetical protein